jgi:hypothetical protein
MDERDEDFSAVWGDVASSSSLHPPSASVEEPPLSPIAQVPLIESEQVEIPQEAIVMQHQKPLSFHTGDGNSLEKEHKRRTFEGDREAFDDPLRSPLMASHGLRDAYQQQEETLLTSKPPLHVLDELHDSTVDEYAPESQEKEGFQEETIHTTQSAFQLSVESPFASENSEQREELAEPVARIEEVEEEEPKRASSTASLPFIDPLEVLKPMDPELHVNVIQS